MGDYTLTLRRRAHGGRQQQAHDLRRRRGLQGRAGPLGAPRPGEVHLQEAARLADHRGRHRAPPRRRRLPHRGHRSTRRPRSRRSRSTSTRWSSGSGSGASSSSRAASSACGRSSSSASRACGRAPAASRPPAASVLLGIMLAATPAARAQSMDGRATCTARFTSTNDEERAVFGSVRCMCGCARLTPGDVRCGTAEAARERIREQDAGGADAGADHRRVREASTGSDALAVPPNTGALPGHLRRAGRWASRSGRSASRG